MYLLNIATKYLLAHCIEVVVIKVGMLTIFNSKNKCALLLLC